MTFRLSGSARNYYRPIISGFLKGPNGYKAEILSGGDNWILKDPSTGVAHLDVRTTAGTADGHSTYIHYTGILRFDDKPTQVLGSAPGATSSEYGDHHWFPGPILETSDLALMDRGHALDWRGTVRR